MLDINNRKWGALLIAQAKSAVCVFVFGALKLAAFQRLSFIIEQLNCLACRLFIDSYYVAQAPSQFAFSIALNAANEYANELRAPSVWSWGAGEIFCVASGKEQHHHHHHWRQWTKFVPP